MRREDGHMRWARKIKVVDFEVTERLSETTKNLGQDRSNMAHDGDRFSETLVSTYPQRVTTQKINTD
jgi:hypothetical protein